MSRNPVTVRFGPWLIIDGAPPDAGEFVEALRAVVADQPVFESVDLDFDTDPELANDERAARVSVVVDELWRFVDTRSLLRLLLDAAPGETQVGLDLHELTGCCVELDPDHPFAESARTAQLAAVSTNAPLIVLTEGSTDSRLLLKAMAMAMAMAITAQNTLAPEEPVRPLPPAGSKRSPTHRASRGHPGEQRTGPVRIEQFAPTTQPLLIGTPTTASPR